MGPACQSEPEREIACLIFHTVEKSDKSPGQQNSNVKLPPTVALQLKEMRSEMSVSFSLIPSVHPYI